MRPYYEEDSITIYHGDCREILPTLPKVDLVLTDPPYGIALADMHFGKNSDARRVSITGDEDMLAGGEVLDLVAGIPTIAFSSPSKPWGGAWSQFLVWDKVTGMGGDYRREWMRSWELIQVRDLGVLNGDRDGAVLRYRLKEQETGIHPTRKPEALLRYLIGKTTKLRANVLDPFMGSGGTLAAAKNLGRRAIGIEIEERYCEIAAKRLAQGVLPLEAA